MCDCVISTGQKRLFHYLQPEHRSGTRTPCLQFAIQAHAGFHFLDLNHPLWPFVAAMLQGTDRTVPTLLRIPSAAKNVLEKKADMPDRPPGSDP
jgi:hypothetical protein